ncbi:MAG TPA: desulfoferrodoxin [Firmicutes bacterium]|nr:desulfoferrodoxin [Bacillota bacterium]
MRKEQQFFICRHCGNLAGMVRNAGVTMLCCGEPMEELVPNSNGVQEKHLPVVSQEGGRVTVTVSENLHPMTEEHSIEWIYLETERGGQRKTLLPDEKPEAVFLLEDDKALAAYAYCNLHGLWRTDL